MGGKEISSICGRYSLSLSLSCLPLLFVCYHSAPLTLQEDPLESRRRREQTVSVSGAAAAASSFLNCDITLSLRRYPEQRTLVFSSLNPPPQFTSNYEMSLALVSVANFGQTFICDQPALPHGIKVTWTSVSFSLVIEELV